MPNWEEDDDEDNGRENQMLGFMFGNVDDAGDLDVEYLDQDAKEHLSALADQLGPSLVDLDLSSSKGTAAGKKGISEGVEDYAKKSEDAVDYEDIDEEYDGPEVQMQPQDEEFYANEALARPSNLAAEDEDYDEGYEEDDYEETDNIEDHTQTTQEASAEAEADSTKPFDFVEGLEGEKEEDFETGQDDNVQDVPDEEDWLEGGGEKVELPVLCEIDGKEVLRFSELFGIWEPYWVTGSRKGRQKKSLLKGVLLGNKDRVENDIEALEMDEEDVLKTCSALNVGAQGSVDDDWSDMSFEDEGDYTEEDAFGVVENTSILLTTEQDSRPRARLKKVQFVSSEPMKSNSHDWEHVSQWAEQVPAANFEPIYQQDWEQKIVWGDVPLNLVGGSPRGMKDDSSSDISEEIVQNAGTSCTEIVSEEISMSRLLSLSGKENMRPGSNQYKPILIEPLTQPFKRIVDLHRHPQMLRLEFSSAGQVVEDQAHAVQNAGISEGGLVTDIVERLQRLKVGFSNLNSELDSCKWLDQVHWGDEVSTTIVKQSPIIFDFRDPNMVFEVPDTKEAQSLGSHAAAMVVVPQLMDTVVEEARTVSSALAQFNISNDKYYTTKKPTQQQKSHAKKRAAHGLKVMHSLPGIKLQTMKPKLTNKDLANFHRPKAIWYPHHNEVAAKEQGKLAAKGPMKVILKTLGGRGSKLQVDASETLEALKAKASKKFGDLKASEQTKVLYCGKELEAGKTFAEQEVPPNSVLHLVRTKIHPWPKAQKLPGENKPTRPPGAFKKKSELSVKDGHVALMEYCEERPLLVSNIGMGARLATYYRKQTATDSAAATLKNERGSWAGVTLPLEPAEDSPFLGDIQAGETQSSLETNLYRAPIFGQKIPCTDFLLVRSAKGKLSLRRIDSNHVVGQQEPHVEVLTPSSKAVQNYVGNRLLVYVYREFRANEKPGQLPRIRADELLSQFPSLSEGFTRKRLKTCADLQKGSGGEMFWVLRKNFRIPSEEELRRMVLPEHVCSYESMQAGLYHLKRIGIQKLTQHSGLNAAIAQLPNDAIVIAAATVIERQLQFSPWNLSSNFVAATLQGRQCIERLEITGVGDPSGRGLGFSYLRVATKPPSSGALVEKKAAAARGGGAVTGTDADLRRLSMDNAREVLLKFKVPEAVIEKMTRWHRIALVRKLSSEQAASGVKVGVAALNKFARGQRMSFLQLQQQTREKCQEVWDRQAQSLSCGEGEESESDGEANGDLDDFAGDLENLLEAEEGEDKDDASKKNKREGMRGLGSRRRALQAQREEDIEDEEAEAAELRRMLMEDDEAEDDQQKKRGGSASNEKKAGQVKDADKSQLHGDHSEGVKKKKQIVRKLKRIIKTLQPDGTYSYKEEMISDPKEIALYLAKKNAAKAAGDGDKLATKGDKPAKAPTSGKKEKKKPAVKDVKVNKVVKLKEKVTKDGLRVICGACGQLGHMRTNKKCPLYMEDADKTSKPDAAVCEGLVERQGTKLTIKTKKKADDLQASRPVLLGLPKVKPLPKEKKDILPEKLPALKIKIPVLQEPGISSAIIRAETSILASSKVENFPLDYVADGARTQGTTMKATVKIVREQASKAERTKEQEQQLGEPQAFTKQLVKPKKLKIKAIDAHSHQLREVKQERREKEKRQRQDVGHRDKINDDIKKQMERQEQDFRILKKKETEKREMEERARALEAQRVEKEKEELEKAREIMEREQKLQKDREDIAREHKEREDRKLQEREERERQQRDMELKKEKWRLEEEAREMERLRQERLRLEESKSRRSNDEERGRGTKKRANPDLSSSQPKRQRKRGGGEVELSNILETVVELLKKSEVSYLFLKPVSKKEAPDYLVYVKRPMDLAHIREKVRKLSYKSREEFRQDVEQIALNAHIYNDGRNPGIPPLADKLLEICDQQLELRHYDLAKAESGVERFGDGQCPGVRTSPALEHRRSGSRMYTELPRR